MLNNFGWFNTLIGRAIDYLPYFIYTFDELGKIGIGKGKAKYTLRNVAWEGKTIYDSESKTLKPFITSSVLIPPLARGDEEESENNPPLANLQLSTPPLANQISSAIVTESSYRTMKRDGFIISRNCTASL